MDRYRYHAFSTRLSRYHASDIGQISLKFPLDTHLAELGDTAGLRSIVIHTYWHHRYYWLFLAGLDGPRIGTL
jgi:hypothetical protein